jgi:hypothetical protein
MAVFIGNLCDRLLLCRKLDLYPSSSLLSATLGAPATHSWLSCVMKMRFNDWQRVAAYAATKLSLVCYNLYEVWTTIGVRTLDCEGSSMTGWHVTAQDIVQWSARNRREAQELLPLLVRRLILASIQPLHISFPAGDSILVGGWDGTLETTQGNPFIPVGLSVWEFGTNQQIQQKAERDYQKRTANSQGLDKSNVSYVFVTTRPWSRCREWVRKKNQQREWKKVVGINADDLETWLHQCPAVHRWFASVIGKRPEGSWDLAQAWDNWSLATQPPCSPNLVIAGRTQQESDLVGLLMLQQPTDIRVTGESEEEAYAFTLAALINSENQYIHARCLVVRDARAWDDLIQSQSPLILIPQFPNPQGIGAAVANGHYVIQCRSASYSDKRTGDLLLPKSDRKAQVQALIAMGLSEAHAKQVVASSRGYLLPIRRHPLLAPREYRRPTWATAERVGGALIAALFAGSWNTRNHHDCDRISELAGIPYDQVEEQLNLLALSEDPPVRRIGDVWQVISRQDTWGLVHGFINSQALQRYAEVALKVLGEQDPRFDMHPEERWMANFHGISLNHSGHLRKGLAEMAALLSAYGDSDCRNLGLSVQDVISRLVRNLLVNDSSKNWFSLHSLLPFLAEAAPDEFLEAVENSLASEHKPIMELFVEEGMMGGCRHAGLLWALEGISWNLAYTSRVVRILGKLDRLDPGGRYANRPLTTLRAMFLGWLPQTQATLSERLSILDMLVRYEPQTGWKLLLALIPSFGSDFSSYIHRPYFREWDEGWTGEACKDEYEEFMKYVGKRVVELVDRDPAGRWPEVIKRLPLFPDTTKLQVVQALHEMRCDEQSDQETFFAIYTALRHVIAENLEFSTAHWALSPSYVEALQELYPKYLPNDLLLRHRYLFDEYSPKVIISNLQKYDYEEKARAIRELRLQALNQVWETGGITAIRRWVEMVSLPALLGEYIAEAAFAETVEGEVLAWLASDNTSLDVAAKSYIHTRFRNDKTWITRVKELLRDAGTEDKWANFCLSLPFGRCTFELLDELGEKVKQIYWTSTNGYYLSSDDISLSPWVLEQYLQYDRPWTAVSVTAYYIRWPESARMIGSDLLAQILEHAAMGQSDEKVELSGTIGSEIVEMIKLLEMRGDLAVERLVRIEWLFINLFSAYGFYPATLIRQLTKDAEWFAELICWAFKADPPIEDEFRNIPENLIQVQAERAYHAIELVNVLPGQRMDNTIDSDALKQWVTKVREICIARNRRNVCDNCIGRVLSHSPVGTDGIWPHESVREIIELFESKKLELGIEVGRYNQRGFTTRDPLEGGTQERQLAEQYRLQADMISHRWPQTAAMLRRMAAKYSRDGQEEDNIVELESFLY